MEINCEGFHFEPSIEDSEIVMSAVIDKILEVRDVYSISLVSNREYEYTRDQTKMLVEIANTFEYLNNKISSSNFENICKQCMPSRMQELQKIINGRLKRDPIGAYVRTKRLARRVRANMDDPEHGECYDDYYENAISPILKSMKKTKIIKQAADYIPGYRIGDRGPYREIFHPSVRPNFMLTRYVTLPPENGEPINRYEVGNIDVEVFKVPDEIRNVYYAVPPEFKLSEDKYAILDQARNLMAEHRPREEEFANLDRMREIFFNIGRDLIRDVANSMNVKLSTEEVDELGEILTRYTAGLGVLEILLADEKVQDIYINSPIGSQPIYIFHSDYEDCETNIIPTPEDAEIWATRFRISSGRPLDEANPVLDTELSVPGGRARVAVITRSLSPEGLGYALRRHRDKPWTYPLFIKNKMINPLAAGLMSFLVDGSRTMLIAGTRSSGKSSFLGATLAEIMKRFRIITVEDTLELPVSALRELGYNIERLKSRSIITNVETELPADEAIRTALRLGDSALIIGEVRSTEAKALYEAMRVGALANVVAGTIHGDSPYGVFDRVVNDLEVPPTSFKATDIIAVANRLKSPDGLHSFRRMLSITEVRKHWKEDPEEEGGFVPLMKYSAKKDTLVPTQTLLSGESTILNEIASNVREWAGNWDAVWENIQLRAKIKETLVRYADKQDIPEIMEVEFSTRSNDMFHTISENVNKEIGHSDSEEIYDRWLEWFKKNAKKKIRGRI